MITLDKLLQAVAEVEPILREHAPAAERERKLSDTAAHAMRDAGLFRMWRPQALGGHEVDPVTAFRVFEEVARIDSAAGWNLQLSTGFDLFGGWFTDGVAQEIFGAPDAILGGAFNPVRKAVPVDGGYRLTGQTPFVSGAHHDTWILGLAHIFEGDTPRLGPGGEPETLLTACPAGEVEILDTWNTMGMRGTGSHDVGISDVFVPRNRAASWVPLETPGEAYAGPLYRLSVWPAVAALAPPALGIARAAIEETIEVVTRKTPAYMKKTLRDRSVVHRQLAVAQGELASGRALLHTVFDELYEKAVAGERLTMQDKAGAQLAATHAIQSAASAVDRVHEIVGASGIREEYRFARHFRDVHVITQHGFTNTAKLESVGQIMLGMDPDWPFFAF